MGTAAAAGSALRTAGGLRPGDSARRALNSPAARPGAVRRVCGACLVAPLWLTGWTSIAVRRHQCFPRLILFDELHRLRDSLCVTIPLQRRSERGRALPLPWRQSRVFRPAERHPQAPTTVQRIERGDLCRAPEARAEAEAKTVHLSHVVAVPGSRLWTRRAFLHACTMQSQRWPSC